jgi:TM2 domain-containing membrane protein YozV
MLSFLVGGLLLMVCWPIALLALLIYPVVWLLLLPFRVLGIGVDAVFSLLKGIVMLPARVLGQRPGH